jgi:tetratricopeptide (TPR) repeat protein
VLGAVVLVGGIGAGSLWLVQKAKAPTSSTQPTSVDLASLWKAQQYTQLIAAADDELRNDPMNGIALVFDGFASFYVGVTQVTQEEKLNYIDRSIISLRRALLLPHPPYDAQIHYVLGKAYYQKGEYFTDLAISNLKQAVAMGYNASDTNEYLGLAYNRLGMYKDGVGYFLKAVTQNPKDVLYLTIAQTYFQLGDNQAATTYVEKAIAASSDDFLVQKARFLLGDIYRKENKLDTAEQEYRKILEKNPQSGEAHYYLGEIYSARGDRAHARAEWREALRIDPNNQDAYKRLRGK